MKMKKTFGICNSFDRRDDVRVVQRKRRYSGCDDTGRSFHRRDRRPVVGHGRNTFNLASGVLGTADTPADIETRRITAAQGYGASYDAIVMPFSYNGNAVSVEFTVDGDAFVWTIDKAEDAKFEAGNEYTYDVTVTRHKVSVSATIKPWVTNDRGPVTAQ